MSTQGSLGVRGEKLQDLPESAKLALAKRLAGVLDDVLEVAASEADVHPASWGPGRQEFFVAFTRSILMHGMLAHDSARNCGADDRALPYVQLLFGLRPALENAGNAWKNSDATEGVQSPVADLAALAGPLQMVVGDLVGDDDLFIRAQKLVYSDID